MSAFLAPKQLIELEARALLTRAHRVRPFALTETMVVAASFSVEAQAAIERHMSVGRHEVRRKVSEFLAWLTGPEGRAATPAEAQQRFVFLRLRFNAVLTQFDLFSEVVTQRSEHETGVFLGGLDVFAKDALMVPGMPYEAPPIVCYLQRGQGAAIRRARTRLPGGGENPVAIIKVPRERMVGSGIASSLVHEVGHQGAALLELVESLRPALQARAAKAGADAIAWQAWDRWCSEIVADLWSVARVGIAAPLGLMGVVSLPRPFVFRKEIDEPHPIPWIRVLLSAALGAQLYPHPQWSAVADTWRALYPPTELPAEYAALLQSLVRSMPEAAKAFTEHKPVSLGGRSIGEALATPDRTPAKLAQLYARFGSAPLDMRKETPSLVFAALGQARADGAITPEVESRTVAHLLTNWALRGAIDMTDICSARMPKRLPSPTADRTATTRRRLTA